MDSAAKQRVRGVRLGKRALVRDNRETFEFWPERVDALKIDLRQPAARQLAGSDPSGQLPERGECDILLIAWKGPPRGPREPQGTLRGGRAEIWRPRVEAARCRHRILETYFAAREGGGNLSVQIFQHLPALGISVADAHETFGALNVRS